MPTHKGVTITVHTPNGPLPEYKSHTRRTVTTAYIAVPSPESPPPLQRPPGPVAPKNTFPPSAPANSFAISISISSEDYKPLTDNPQEHLAAYLYLDGKEEEAAAMLTRRRDTWISSRWCAMEDGSIGEKAFMWREVGLESFLGSLNLSREEKDAHRAATEAETGPKAGKKGRLIRRNTTAAATTRKSLSSSPSMSPAARDLNAMDSDSEEVQMRDTPPRSPSLSDNDDDEDTAPPAQIKNTVGQIKLKLYRVLADGAPKYGVFEPKKDEEDGMMEDDEAVPELGHAAKADVSHTTGFAPAQKVDKDLIWSQTVTCLDPLSSPWATFIIFYRGDRQLKKMGVIRENSPSLSPNLSPASPLSPNVSRKRQSMRLEDAFKNLKPLPPPSSASGFFGFRETNGNGANKKKKTPTKKTRTSEDSDDDSDKDGLLSVGGHNLRSRSLGEPTEQEKHLEEGIRKMKLKRSRATTPLPPGADGPPPPDDPSSWEWYEKYSTPPGQTVAGSRNGIHRRTKSAAGLLQKMVNEGAVGEGLPPQGVASPAKRARRRESAMGEDEEL